MFKESKAEIWADRLFDPDYEFDADRRAMLAKWILSLDLEAY